MITNDPAAPNRPRDWKHPAHLVPLLGLLDENNEIKPPQAGGESE